MGDLSTRGYCLDCGRWRVEENILQLQARRGPFAAKHAARLIQGVASALPPLDELTEEGYAPSHE